MSAIMKKEVKSAPVASSRGKRSAMPSDKLNPKTVNMFSSQASKHSVFEAVYTKGGVPCRLSHGSVKHKLQWDTPKEEVSFDPVLVTLAEGLRETRHPFTFVAVEGFKDLLLTPNSAQKTIPLLPRLTTSIKMALMAKDDTCFDRGLTAISCLSDCIGPKFDSALKILMTCLARKLSSDRTRRANITAVLQQLEANGGSEVLTIIKSKVPTYCSVHV